MVTGKSRARANTHEKGKCARCVWVSVSLNNLRANCANRYRSAQRSVVKNAANRAIHREEEILINNFLFFNRSLSSVHFLQQIAGQIGVGSHRSVPRRSLRGSGHRVPSVRQARAQGSWTQKSCSGKSLRGSPRCAPLRTSWVSWLVRGSACESLERRHSSAGTPRRCSTLPGSP